MATAAETLAREIAELRRRLVALERTGQLSRSTVPGPDGEPVTLGDGVRAGITAGAQAAEAIAAATSAQAKADGAVEAFFGADEPKGGKLGDLWRQPTGEVLQHDGGAWVAVSDPQVRADLDAALNRLVTTEGALDGKVSTYFAPILEAPEAAAVGDLWIVSDLGNLLRRWDGREWVDARDAGIEEAVSQADDAAEAAEAAQDTADSALLSATRSLVDAAQAATAAQEAAQLAATAQTDAAEAAGIAEGKGDVLIQAAAPAEAFRKATTLWIDTTSNANTPKRWNGSAWAAVTDKRASDAATSATNAAKAAQAAQGTADQAATAAQEAASAAQAAKARADQAHALAGTAEDNAQAAITSAAGAQEAARLAQGTADTASADAASAAGLAEGKADVLIQAAAPATAMRKATTLWIDITSNANTPKRWNGTAWAAVTDKKATDAATAASNAAKAAAAAQAAADTVSKNLFSTAAPSGTAPYGSTWFRVNSSGQVIGQWQQTATGNGSTWTVREIRSEVIANLDVGKVTAGTLAVNEAVAKKLFAEVVRAQMVEAEEFIGENAILKGSVTADKLEADLVLASRVIAGDPDGIRAEMSPEGFKVYGKASGDTTAGNETYEIVRLGVHDTNDMFAIADRDGITQASISETGVISGKSVYASDDIILQGKSLEELLWEMPRGHIASGFRYNDSLYNAKPGGEWAPYLRLDVEVERNRLYKVSTSPVRFGQDPGGVAAIRIVQSTGSVATTGSVTINNVDIFDGHDGNSVMLSEITQLGGATTNGPAGDKVLVSWMLMFKATKGQFGIRANGVSPVRLLVEDLGPLRNTFTGIHLDTTSSNGVPPAAPPAKLTYTNGWDCNWIRSFQGNGNIYPMGDKGYQGLSPAGYGNLKSVMLFPDMTGTLSGSVIHEIKVYLYFEHWYNNAGGTARIGLYNAGFPTTYGGGTVVTTSAGWPKPGGRWVTIPTQYYSGFQSGHYRGITLEGDGTYNSYGIAHPPKIQITYTK